jgi:hypothetical protein
VGPSAHAAHARRARRAYPRGAAAEIIHSPAYADRGFAGWDGAERVAVNVAMLYRGFEGKRGRVSQRERLGLLMGMARLAG